SLHPCHIRSLSRNAEAFLHLLLLRNNVVNWNASPVSILSVASAHLTEFKAPAEMLEPFLLASTYNGLPNSTNLDMLIFEPSRFRSSLKI
ncbi:hypothetical protein, partial [Vibrio splendidus]|uniref:hypothetical protein n=1 Tax=Vibrio splendidus TaxID=29497 RepID=UPI001C627EF9